MTFRLSRLTTEMPVLVGALLALAVLLTGASIFVYQKSRIFVASAKPIQAEIIDIVHEPVPREEVPLELAERSRLIFRWIPVFQYTVDGAVFERRLDAKAAPIGETADSLRYAIGDTTTIYYDPENPSEIRDVLAPDANLAPSVLAALAGFAWLVFGVCTIQTLRLLRRAAQTARTATVTRCRFIALEGTRARSQRDRMIRLVCRWIHPETGVEWLLRSPNLHPSDLPANLEIGTMIPCEVDFENPSRHQILWRELESAGSSRAL